MAKYRKILVAYDGSAPAKNALAIASQMAKVSKSWIKVIAVLPNYEGDLELIGVQNIRDTMEGPGRQLLAEAQQIADDGDFHILTNLEQGEPYDRIVHVAEDENCDLIVMGRKGLSPLERELMGSVTARVIGHTNRDVLVVPEGATLNWTNLLLATDNGGQTDNATTKAMVLAKEYGSRLTVLSVVYTNDEFMALAHEMIHGLVLKSQAKLEKLVEKGSQEGISIIPMVREGEPHEVINRQAGEQNADLIIMGARARMGFGRILMGSVTERTIGYADRPVLIVH
ncbi:MAG: universal stress protein [Proteobacteria bacterium]|nr:universal stress protein [Pseudomonadota bacterium]MBU1687979.1 universal stress protein [Pseudomonadota bacterium]